MKRRLILPFALTCFLIFIWEVAIPYWGGGKLFLPPPSKFLPRIWHYPHLFGLHTWVTASEMVIAWLFAALCSLPLGYLMFRFWSLRKTLQPLFIIVQCLPMFTLAPIMLLLFGWSKTAIIIPTVLMVFFPLALSVLQGLRSVPPSIRAFADLHQTSFIKKLIYIEFPYSLGHLMQGLKVSTAVAGVGAIAGEWAGAQQGLGIFMLESRRSMDFESVFAALFLLVFVSIIFYCLIALVERYLIKKRYVQISL